MSLSNRVTVSTVPAEFGLRIWQRTVTRNRVIVAAMVDNRLLICIPPLTPTVQEFVDLGAPRVNGFISGAR